MKRLTIVICLIFLFSCSNQKFGGSIVLYNEVAFQILENEKEDSSLIDAADTFEQLILSSSIQIPLFKVVRSDDLDIYLGLPLGFDFEKYSDKDFVHEKYELLNEEFIIGESSYKTYSTEQTYLVEYIVRKNKSTFYTLFKTNSKKVFNSELGYDKVTKRYK